MKKHAPIVQFLFGAALLFVIAFQSADGFGHLVKQFGEKQCEHKYAGKTDISHAHHDLEKCFVCEFTFSHFISADDFTFSYKNPVAHSGYTVSHSREITQFFRGSLFSLRGPPTFIA